MLKKIISIAVLTGVIIAFALGCGYLMGFDFAETTTNEDRLTKLRTDNTLSTAEDMAFRAV